ncbi:hypothetical protein [Cytobacillus praedii]|uniref:hypothetical protein n=1 Tax=Cytobacillus praedii TaxID=1742358 RepID=UPI002E1DF424|nr:hypothetical protein [Cytobacillus praedii]
MSEGMKITIEEWSNDCDFEVSKEQIEELIDALNVCNEVEDMSFMFQRSVKSEKDKEIEELKNKIRVFRIVYCN